MSKETMLKRAFNQVSANDAVRYADKNVDFLVIKNYMMEYAKKNGVEISAEEVEKYISQQLAKMDACVKDFTYQTKMMN